MSKAISIYASHDSSICVVDNNGNYRVYELERFLNERYCRINIKDDFEEILQDIKKVIINDTGIDTFDICYFGQFLKGKVDEQKKIFAKVFNVKEFIEVNHHYSHASTALYQSEFDKSLIVSFDGGGWEAGVVDFFNVYIGDKTTGEISKIKRVNIDLGTAYSLLAIPVSEVRKGNFLSYAGKIMGIAGYGNVISEWVAPIKHFYVNQVGDRTRQLTALGNKIGLNLGENQLSGQKSYDLAATSQYVFETIVMDIILPLIEQHQLPVCLTGGCALNVLFNEKLRNTIKYPVFVPPNPNDCGLSFGHLVLHEPPKKQVKITYSGFSLLDQEELPSYIKKYGATKVTTEDVAKLIVDGKIIGLVQGNSEVGPRALGNRSIICDPSFKDMKDILNAKVKFREWFRPFAPVVRAEEVEKYFDFSGESEYMSFAPKVNEEYREQLSSITHIDGTARAQTITKQQNEYLYDIISQVDKLKGIGVILNTSFNILGRPILTRIEEAIHVLENTELDYVLVEGYLFKKLDK